VEPNQFWEQNWKKLFSLNFLPNLLQYNFLWNVEKFQVIQFYPYENSIIGTLKPIIFVLFDQKINPEEVLKTIKYGIRIKWNLKISRVTAGLERRFDIATVTMEAAKKDDTINTFIEQSVAENMLLFTFSQNLPKGTSDLELVET
jgi:hypothetical protein